MSFLKGLLPQFRQRIERLADQLWILRLANKVAKHAPVSQEKPVIFFNATTRLGGLSLNAGFALVSAWAVRLAGVPVVHFVCRAGMTRCVLGTDPDDITKTPPCTACSLQSRIAYAGATRMEFSYRPEPGLQEALRSLDVAGLSCYEHPFEDGKVPLGAIVLPSIRWRLRAHNLQDDEPTRFLFREFLYSAWNILLAFDELVRRIQPQEVVLFNGQFFPEGIARWLCARRGVRSLTHEVGMQPMSGYFTSGEATAYPIDIPKVFELSPDQNRKLDTYLENRFQGNFSMAGIQFWPEMKRLDNAFLEKLAGFSHLVPVFTNVIFDTSQPHANTLFSDMFSWLDLVLDRAKSHSEILFVIRAHPDESRPGKASRESVAGWVAQCGADRLPNVVFIPPDEYVSSYEMIQRAKFVMVYNSTIGLEASILGAAVLSAGKARYTQYPTVFFPESHDAYQRMLDEFLTAEKVEPLPEHLHQARRFMYYQLFRTSLPFGDFLEATRQRGYVRLARFSLNALSPQRTSTIRAVLDGILAGGDFLLKD